MLAGASRMPQRAFLTANVIGAAIWAVGITLLGYFLGKQIGSDNIDKYLLPIVAVIIVLSLIPPFLEWRKHRKHTTQETSPASHVARCLHQLDERRDQREDDDDRDDRQQVLVDVVGADPCRGSSRATSCRSSRYAAPITFAAVNEWHGIRLAPASIGTIVRTNGMNARARPHGSRGDRRSVSVRGTRS